MARGCASIRSGIRGSGTDVRVTGSPGGSRPPGSRFAEVGSWPARARPEGDAVPPRQLPGSRQPAADRSARRADDPSGQASSEHGFAKAKPREPSRNGAASLLASQPARRSAAAQPRRVVRSERRSGCRTASTRSESRTRHRASVTGGYLLHHADPLPRGPRGRAGARAWPSRPPTRTGCCRSRSPTFFVVTAGLPARPAWVPGLVFGVAFQFTLLWWMHVVGHRALAGPRPLTQAAGTACWARPRCRCGASRRRRSGWRRPGSRWRTIRTDLAGRRHAVGPAVVRRRRHAGGRCAAVRRRDRGEPASWRCPGRCWRRRTPPADGRLRLARRSSRRRAGAGIVVPLARAVLRRRRDRAVDVAAVQGNVPGDGTDVLAHYRQITDQHADETARLAADVAAGRDPEAGLRGVAGELHGHRPVRGPADARRHRGGGRPASTSRCWPGSSSTAGRSTSSTRASCSTRSPAPATATPSGTRCRSASTSRGAGCSAPTSPSSTRSRATW